MVIGITTITGKKSKQMEEIPVRVSRGGIRYFLEESHAFPSVSFGVFVKSGCRFEEENLLGIAHFIEHMVFKETKNRTSYEISHAVESLGGEINAFTSSEYSVFYVKLLRKDIRTGVEILSDIMKNPTFNSKLLEREREVVLEEINEYYDDPQDICQTEALKTIWGNDPASRNPLGKEETVKKISSSDAFSYFSKFFNRENTFISVVGDIDEKTVEELLNEYFDDFNGDFFTPEIQKSEYKFNEIKYEKDTAQMHLAITFKGSSLFGEENLKNSLFTTILGGNMSSRLFQHLREERGLVYTVYAYPVRLSDIGGSVVYASTTPKKINDVSGLIYSELEDIRRNGLKKSEFEDAKKYLLGSLVLGLESMTSRMQRNGVHGLFLGRIETVHKLMEKLEKISFDDFSAYVSDLLSSEMGKVIVGKI